MESPQGWHKGGQLDPLDNWSEAKFLVEWTLGYDGISGKKSHFCLWQTFEFSYIMFAWDSKTYQSYSERENSLEKANYSFPTFIFLWLWVLNSSFEFRMILLFDTILKPFLFYVLPWSWVCLTGHQLSLVAWFEYATII